MKVSTKSKRKLKITLTENEALDFRDWMEGRKTFGLGGIEDALSTPIASAVYLTVKRFVRGDEDL